MFFQPILNQEFYSDKSTVFLHKRGRGDVQSWKCKNINILKVLKYSLCSESML